MSEQDIAQQTIVENRLLKTIMEGIRETLVWKPTGTDFSRKLTTLRFISQSLQRHLEHLMTLEEYDGYMDFVVTRCPHLSKTVETLRQDHDCFRGNMRRLCHQIERASSADAGTFVDICANMDDFLTKLEAHNKTETRLMQEAFERTEGGEG
jgi:hypothetical protein